MTVHESFEGYSCLEDFDKREMPKIDGFTIMNTNIQFRMLKKVEEVKSIKERLQGAIAANPMVDLDFNEFTLMHKDHEGFWFKHRMTRNYICLRWDDEVIIPRTDMAFYRGEFTVPENKEQKVN